MILLAAFVAAQSLEWAAIPVDPPGTTPRQYVRAITVQAGKPVLVTPYTASPTRTGSFASLPATLMGNTTWCIDPAREVVLASLAVEIDGLGVYTFNPSQPELGQPTQIGTCRSALNISGLRVPAVRVLAFVWRWD